MASDDYYDEPLSDFRSLQNQAAKAEWFESTEPGDQPTHSRATSCARAEGIGHAMLAKLSGDVLRCAIYAWPKGFRIPGRNEKIQPLADNRS